MGFPYVPDGYTWTCRKYDHDLNYGPYHEHAKAAFTRRAQMVDCELLNFGAEKVHVMPEIHAAHVRQRIDAGLLNWTDKRQIGDILTVAFNPEVDSRLISFFESEYVPTQIGFGIHKGTGALAESGGWHCDSGPTKHLVMILYLTPSEGAAGNTVFANKEITKPLIDAGYIACKVEDRLDDITPVLDDLSLEPFEEVHFDMHPGEALIFEAGALMHKGVPPVHEARYTMVLALVPSTQHWMEAIRSTPFPLPTGKTPYGTFPLREV